MGGGGISHTTRRADTHSQPMLGLAAIIIFAAKEKEKGVSAQQPHRHLSPLPSPPRHHLSSFPSFASIRYWYIRAHRRPQKRRKQYESIHVCAKTPPFRALNAWSWETKMSHPYPRHTPQSRRRLKSSPVRFTAARRHPQQPPRRRRRGGGASCAASSGK